MTLFNVLNYKNVEINVICCAKNKLSIIFFTLRVCTNYRTIALAKTNTLSYFLAKTTFQELCCCCTMVTSASGSLNFCNKIWYDIYCFVSNQLCFKQISRQRSLATRTRLSNRHSHAVLSDTIWLGTEFLELTNQLVVWNLPKSYSGLLSGSANQRLSPILSKHH